MPGLLRWFGAASRNVAALIGSAVAHVRATVRGDDGAYKAFTTAYDEIVLAKDLFYLEERVAARTILDQEIARIALDGGSETVPDLRDTVVTLLVDNSGSFRSPNKSYKSALGWADESDAILAVAASVDIASRKIERAGGKVEILGYTTVQWKGGQSRRDWIAAGAPPHPGRLNDLRHIIYKSADLPYADARLDISVMISLDLLKENVDGEALAWAYQRLLARPESIRILVVISDGAPVDDSTLFYNDDGCCLNRHLEETIRDIVRDNQVKVAGIGIKYDVRGFYDVEPLSCIALNIDGPDRLADAIDRAISMLHKSSHAVAGRNVDLGG